MAREQCSAKTRLGERCQAKAVRGKTVCRVHGGSSDGAPKGNRNAETHGIYGKHFTDDEIEELPSIKARIGTLGDEITLLRIRMGRALKAEQHAFDNDENGLEIVKRHDREASEFGPGDETVSERVDYGAHVERLARRIESLEKTRAELIKMDRENPPDDDDEPPRWEIEVVPAKGAT